MIARLLSASRNVGDPIRDLQQIVIDGFLDVAVELAPLDRGEDLQLLVDLGADMDAGRNLLGVAETLTGNGIAAFALGDQIAELSPASRRYWQCAAIIVGFRRGGEAMGFSRTDGRSRPVEINPRTRFLLSDPSLIAEPLSPSTCRG